jgi:hypothetical protein
MAVGEEPPEPRRCLGHGIGRGDAHDVEALGERADEERLLMFFRVRRESRTAPSPLVGQGFPPWRANGELRREG